MFCRKCGFKNDDDAVFCGRCGERMEEEEPQEELRFPQPSLKEVPSSEVIQQEEVYQEEAPVHEARCFSGRPCSGKARCFSGRPSSGKARCFSGRGRSGEGKEKISDSSPHYSIISYAPTAGSGRSMGIPEYLPKNFRSLRRLFKSGIHRT